MDLPPRAAASNSCGVVYTIVESRTLPRVGKNENDGLLDFLDVLEMLSLDVCMVEGVGTTEPGEVTAVVQKLFSWTVNSKILDTCSEDTRKRCLSVHLAPFWEVLCIPRAEIGGT